MSPYQRKTSYYENACVFGETTCPLRIVVHCSCPLSIFFCLTEQIPRHRQWTGSHNTYPAMCRLSIVQLTKKEKSGITINDPDLFIRSPAYMKIFKIG